MPRDNCGYAHVLASKLNAKRALLASWKEGAIMERERGRIFLAAVQGGRVS